MRGAITLGILALVILTVPAMSSAGNIQPLPSDPMLLQLQSIAAASPNFNYYTQVVKIVQQLNISLHVVIGLGGPLNYFFPAWSNLTNATPTTAHLLGAITWVNVTQGCGVFNCYDINLTCDGSVVVFNYASPPSTEIDRTCWKMTWPFSTNVYASTHNRPNAPNYTVTHLLTIEQAQHTQWFFPGPGQEGTVTNLTILTPEVWHAVVPIQSYTNPGAAWDVPFPPGTWDPALTTVVYNNLSQPVSTFTESATALLLRWDSISYGSQNYSVTFFGQALSGFGLGYGNSTFIGSLTLNVANLTPTSNGFFQAEGSWVNERTEPFTGQVELVGSWVPTATQVSTKVNGIVVPSVWTQGAVTIPAGTVNVTNGSTVEFQVTFFPQSTFSFTRPIAVFNGFGINWLEVAGAVGVALAVFLSWTRLTGRLEVTVNGIVAVLMVTGTVGVFIAAR